MGCEESARVLCPMVAARRVSPVASASFSIARACLGFLGVVGVAGDLHLLVV